MYNVIAAHEVLNYVRQSKELSLLLKFDFENAFDNVD
jgi:hypothetical protein